MSDRQFVGEFHARPHPMENPDVHVTKTGRVLDDANFEALADEAELGYDLSGRPPTLPGLWIAELISESGRVVARVVLTERRDADEALAANWRVVCYVRADLAQQTP